MSYYRLIGGPADNSSVRLPRATDSIAVPVYPSVAISFVPLTHATQSTDRAVYKHTITNHGDIELVFYRHESLSRSEAVKHLLRPHSI